MRLESARIAMSIFRSALLAVTLLLLASAARADSLDLIEVERAQGFTGPVAVAWSPDDEYLYAADYDGNAIVVLARGGGGFTFVQEVVDETLQDGRWVEGLGGCSDVVVSPDGAHVYATGLLDDAVVAFSRDAATGELKFGDAEYDGGKGVVGLNAPSALTFDPDGVHLYVSSQASNALALFERDPGSGELRFVDAWFDGVDGVEGLAGASDVAVADDGRSVYVTGSTDRAVAVFQRNQATGRVRFVDVEVDGDGGVAGLEKAQGVAIDETGQRVFVVSTYFENSLVIFSRDPGSGELQWMQTLGDGVDGSDGLYGAEGVATSDDGSSVYVAASIDSSVAHYRSDPGSGVFALADLHDDGVGGVDGLLGASSVALAPDGMNLYATGSSDDAVVTFSRDPSDGSLTFVGLLDKAGGIDALDGAEGVAVSPDDQNVYVTGLQADALAVFSRGPDGVLTFVESFFDADVNGLDGATDVSVAPDGTQVFVTGVNDKALVVFDRDPSDGALSWSQTFFDGIGGVDGLYGAREVVAAADGAAVYVAAAYDDAVAIFGRDTQPPHLLTFVGVVKDTDDGVDGLNQAEGITIAPDDGSILVVASQDRTLATFDRNLVDQTLTLVQIIEDGAGGVDGLEGASGVAVSPDGSQVLVAAEVEDEVSVFRRALPSGALTYVGLLRDDEAGVDGLDGAADVRFSADGANVYVAGTVDAAVAVFTRNLATGTLEFREVEIDNVGGVDGLSGVSGIALTNDDRSLAAAGRFDKGLALFDRLPGAGKLEFVGAALGPLGGPGPGLDGAAAVAVSPDGLSVYVAGKTDHALATFHRDPMTGEVEFLDARVDGQDGVDGLSGASAVAVHPDGFAVFATGESDNALARFDRDPTTGLLSFDRLVRDGDPGVNGLSGASSVTVSPEGNHVYTTALYDDAIALFDTDLTFLGAWFDTTDAMCLNGASGAALTPDGLCVYVAARDDSALCVFQRDPASGALTWVQELRDGDQGLDGLSYTRGVAASPDGLSLYATGWNDDALVAFSVEAGTCLLTFQEIHNAATGDTFLDGAYGVEVADDGSAVWAAAELDDAVSSFIRNPSTGLLTRVAAVSEADLHQPALNGAVALASSPDGAHLYAVANQADALTAFRRVSFAVVDFASQPDVVTSNLSTYLVTGMADVDSLVFVNDAQVPVDGGGNFVATVQLTGPTNIVELRIEPPAGEPAIVTKTVNFDPSFSTGGERLLLVDVVDVLPVDGELPPASAPGTWVIDLDQGAVLGLLADRHVRGISPDGAEAYFEDREVLDPSNWAPVDPQPLSFSQPIAGNAFAVSPDGAFLYSGPAGFETEKLERSTNLVVATSPFSLATGDQWSNAEGPGGPGVSPDGGSIACCSADDGFYEVDTTDLAFLWHDLEPPGRAWQSDLIFSPDGTLLAKTTYAGSGTWSVEVIETANWERAGIVDVTGDFGGEAVFAPDGRWLVAGCDGNPLFRNGRIALIDPVSMRVEGSVSRNLADNLAISDTGEVFASSGDAAGIEAFTIDDAGRLVPTGLFRLGVNHSIVSSGFSKYDQIRRIIFKPAFAGRSTARPARRQR